MVKLNYLTSTMIFAFSWSATNGLLKGSSSVKPSAETRARKLMMDKKDNAPEQDIPPELEIIDQVPSCENDANVKVIGCNDCEIQLNSNDNDSLIILEEDMECNLDIAKDAAISISSSRTTLDCRGHKIINRGNSGNGIVINCDISLFEQGIQIASSQNVLLENIESHENIRNGLILKGLATTDVTVLDSKFENNDLSGVAVVAQQQVSNLFLSGVSANKNKLFGFAFNTPVTGKLLSVDAKENLRSGIDSRGESTNLFIQDSKFCGNSVSFGDVGVLEGTVLHQAITCSVDQDPDIDICDCQC